MDVHAGDAAPAFRAQATDGTTVSLADYRGRYLVLYFYPKAFTPGCTREARRFRHHYPEIESLGAEVVGVSVDDQTVQCDFAARNQVSFPLIADDDKAVSNAYGVLRRLLPVAKRVTFVVDPNGKVAARFDHELQVSRHLDDVIRFLRRAMAAPPK